MLTRVHSTYLDSLIPHHYALTLFRLLYINQHRQHSLYTLNLFIAVLAIMQSNIVCQPTFATSQCFPYNNLFSFLHRQLTTWEHGIEKLLTKSFP